jgi:uncharacterized protein
MIVYQSTKRGFLEDTSNGIEDIIRVNVKEKLNRDIKAGSSEYESWRNSLGNAMHHVMNTDKIPDDVGVAVEYSIPRTNNRIDFVVTGRDENNIEKVIIIELKQWTDIQLTDKDGMVLTRFKQGMREHVHPSYQAWSYSTLLNGFNATVYDEGVGLKPCAYLHNYTDENVLKNSFYDEYLEKAPSFCKGDKARLQDFISQFVKYGDNNNLLYRIDNGEIRPSKHLADSMVSMIQGNDEFVMIDEQKIVFEAALALAKKSSPTKKNVLIVEGGPGTGKSVLAVNLLVAITKLGLMTQYVSKNAAPRAVYETKLTGTLKKTHISNMFKGSGGYIDCEPNTFDVLIVDEAHRLNEKSGLYQNLGDNQVKELIIASKLAVFFVDEDQKVTLKDIGGKEEIKNWAKDIGVEVTEMQLTSQFRCNGSDGYLAWLDNVLQISETANLDLNGINYDFRIVDTPQELFNLIEDKNKVSNKARMVAGYCWNWVSRRKPNEFDIDLPEYNFKMKWNLASDGNLWIVKPESVHEVGCIHTCQGLEVDYIGVIVGLDIGCVDGKVVTNPARRAATDMSIKGYKKLLLEEPEYANFVLDRIIKNTYRTLMTRGMKGCYVFFLDKELEQHFKDNMRVGQSHLVSPAQVIRNNQNVSRSSSDYERS